MDSQTLAAIRLGGAEEIVALYKRRSELLAYCAALEGLPDNQAKLTQLQQDVRTIDNYMRNRLQAVCKVGWETILGFPDQCRTVDRLGIAPGDFDTAESGQRFINPALPGYVVWGVPGQADTSDELALSPLVIQHFDGDNVQVALDAFKVLK